MILDDKLRVLNENNGIINKCGTMRGNEGPSIDRWPVHVNRCLVQRRFKYLIFQDSKHEPIEEHQCNVGRLMGHTFYSSFH